MTCKQLKDATKISSRTLERYVSGNRDIVKMNIENAAKIAKVLEVDVTDLY